MAIEKEGVELVAEGVAKFLSDMKKAEVQYDKTTGRFRDLGTGKFIASGPLYKAAKDAGFATNEIGKSAQVLGDLFQGATSKAAGGVGQLVTALGGPAGLVGAIGLGVVAFKGFKAVIDGVINTAKKLLSMFAEAGEEGLMLAGRFEEAEAAALAIGRSMGLAEQEIRGGIDTIHDAGIRYDKAAEIAAKFTRNQIDLASSTDLVRVAQATGILIGEDSTATMERLTDAIVTGNTARLTALQITVDNKEALQAHADELGKNVKALTDQEQVQARVNAIIKQSANLMDVYDAAMQSPTKRLRSFTGRELPEFKAAMMQAFLPAFSTVIGGSHSGIRGFINALSDATKEGGALYPVLMKLGAMASLMADAFNTALTWIAQNLPAVIGYIDKVLGNLLLAVFNPRQFLVEASNLVLGIESEFNKGFGRTAEDMFRWGAEIIAGFAEGMVYAARQAMQVMADTVNSLLSFWFAPGSPPRVAPDVDKWGAGAMAEYLRGFTDADFSVLKSVQSSLGKFLSPEKMQELSKSLIGDISAGGGVGESFFDRVAKSAGVFGKEVAKLARGEYALAKATQAMDDANRRYESSQAKVAKSTREYNELLRAGASQKELDAKLAEIRTAEQEQATAAAEKMAAAQDVSGLEEQVNLQKQLVDQLAQLFKESSKSTGIDEKDLGGGLAKTLSDAITPGTFDITSKIGASIDAMKEQLKEKFADIFKPLVDAWGNIKLMIFGGQNELGEPVAGIVQIFGGMVDNIRAFIANLFLAWSTFKTNLIIIFTAMSIKVLSWVSKIGTWFTVDVPGYIETLKTKLTETFIPVWETLRDLIGGDENSVIDVVGRLGEKFKTWFMPEVMEPFLNFLAKPKGLLWALGQIIELFFRPGGIIEGVATVASVVLDAAKAWSTFVSIFDKGAEEAMDPFVAHSPSPLEKGLRGATEALRPLINQWRQLQSAAGGPFPVGGAQAVRGGAAGGDYSRSYQGSANVGPNYFNTPIDVAMIETIATRAVRKAMQGV